MKNNKKGIELFGMLKSKKIDKKPSLYINIYFNQDPDNEGEIDIKVPYQDYDVDKDNGVINIYKKGVLIYIIPYKKNENGKK